MAYGFQGFSYPLEDDNCNSYTNSFNRMNQDFARMKKDFGASIVRMYYPTCTQPGVFENAIRAAAKNNMALILQVWTNFGDGVRLEYPLIITLVRELSTPSCDSGG